MNDVAASTPPTTGKTPPETLDADFAQLFAELSAEVLYGQRKGRTHVSVNPDDLEVVLNRAQPGVLEQENGTDYRLVGSSCCIVVGDFLVYIRKHGLGVVAEIHTGGDDHLDHLVDSASTL